MAMTFLPSNYSCSVLACPSLAQSKLPPRKTLIWRKPVSRFSAIHAQRRICELIDLHHQQIPYEVAWPWQKELVREKKAQIEEEGDCTDTLIVLQHPPVYTLGTGSSEDNLNFDIDNAPYNIYRTERGGEVTYHGPGQLVMYPIINLRNHKMDLHWYLRSLEEIIIRVLSSTFSIKASRLEGLTGVWVGNRKVAAVGIRVSQWITYHGLALNVTTDLTPFNWIVPCGIRDRQVGSIKGLLKELGSFMGEETADDATLIHNTYKSLVQEFSHIFELECLHKTIPYQDYMKGDSKLRSCYDLGIPYSKL